MLHNNLGIDPVIADYFANKRPVPAGNRFWEGRRIYLSGGFGFLTIPIVFDLQHRMGIALDYLLADAHVSLMEQGFDRLRRYEDELMDMPAFLTSCSQLLDGKIKQRNLAADLFSRLSGKPSQYFSFEEQYQSLARSDMFLFTLVDLDVTDEWVHRFLPLWYAVARPILLMDDFVDLEEDRSTGENENSIIEMGNDKNAIIAAYERGKNDIERLADVNAQMARYLQYNLDSCLNRQYIRQQLGS